MMRLLGVLVGSALAVVALVVFIGIPEFTTTTSVTEEPVITLPLRPTVVAESERNSAPPPPAPVETSDQAIDEVPEASGTVPAVAIDEVPETSGTVPAEAIEQSPVVEEPKAIETMQQWYAFWSPFRSEIAANGFVEQLQRVTGLDYRVVRVKPGTYEVAFAYEDDQEITANLSQISAATGLQLPEG